MNPTPDSDRSVPVTATRSHDGMTKQAGLLESVTGTLNLGDVSLKDIEWTHKPALDGRPEMWRAKINGIEIWCKEVDPSIFENQITGLLEVKIKEVTQEQGQRGGRDEKSRYLYVNVLPLPTDADTAATVSIVRLPKFGQGKNRRKVLPADFNPETDFATYRGREPWQVIQIR